MRKTESWLFRTTLLVLAGAVIPACGSSNPGSGTTLTQIERLGRPAINEGLVVTNDFLNAFNSIPPSADLSPAAAPVVAEAAATMTALGNSPTRVGDLASAFLPDVLRIDTTIASPVGTEAYPNGAVAIGALGVVRPVAGRKIEDSVMHVTLSVLTNGGVTTDNVTYPGAGTPAQPGHKRLMGQGAYNSTAMFPFVAAPN
jgi:hypothetical protein